MLMGIDKLSSFLALHRGKASFSALVLVICGIAGDSDGVSNQISRGIGLNHLAFFSEFWEFVTTRGTPMYHSSHTYSVYSPSQMCFPAVFFQSMNALQYYEEVY